MVVCICKVLSYPFQEAYNWAIYLHIHSRHCRLIRTVLIRKKKSASCFKKVLFINQYWPKQGNSNPNRLVHWQFEGLASCLKKEANSVLLSCITANFPLCGGSQDASPLYFNFPSVHQMYLPVIFVTLLFARIERIQQAW